MKTQIEHGIFDYCAAPVVSSTLMLDAETQPAGTHLQAAQVLGGALFGSAEHAPALQA